MMEIEEFGDNDTVNFIKEINKLNLTFFPQFLRSIQERGEKAKKKRKSLFIN